MIFEDLIDFSVRKEVGGGSSVTYQDLMEVAQATRWWLVH